MNVPIFGEYTKNELTSKKRLPFVCWFLYFVTPKLTPMMLQDVEQQRSTKKNYHTNKDIEELLKFEEAIRE